MFDWESESSLTLTPAVNDMKYLSGDLLPKLGRATAVQIWTASKARNVHTVVDIDDDIQIVAITQNIEEELDIGVASAGARMLYLGGKALEDALVAGGVLVDLSHVHSGASVPKCTSLKKVIDYFQRYVYVFAKTQGHPPCPKWNGLICTCEHFCRYQGCEHVEYVKMLELRLRPSSSSVDVLPVVARRGRVQGTAMTQRGAARAVRKEIAKAKPKVRVKATAIAKAVM